MARWTNSKDGTPRTDLMVRHRLDADELARLLAYGAGRVLADVNTMPVAQVVATVREVLQTEGSESIMDTNADDEHRAAIRRAFGGE